MNICLYSSLKIHLIVAALLVFSACGSESTSDNTDRQAEKPIVDGQVEPAGANCEFGGTLVRMGVDKNEDGVLSEDEVTATTYVCHDEPKTPEPDDFPLLMRTDVLEVGDENCPHGGARVQTGRDKNEDGVLSEDEITATTYVCHDEPKAPEPDDFPLLTTTDPLEVGDENCPHGGTRVRVGFDLDEDGVLSEQETTQTSYLCDEEQEVDVCSSVLPLEILSIRVDDDEYGRHQAGYAYRVRVALNQAIDPEQVVFKDMLQTLGQDDPLYTIDADDPQIAWLSWEPTQISEPMPIALVASDGCHAHANAIFTPAILPSRPGLKVSYSDEGFVAAGDTIEVCWTTRNVNSCKLVLGNGKIYSDLQDGCQLITAQTLDITRGKLSMNLLCEGNVAHDPDNPRINIINYGKTFLVGSRILSYDTSDRAYLDAPGELDFVWSTFGMQTCSLLGAESTIDVPLQSPEHLPFAAQIDATGDYALRCEDAEGKEYSRQKRVLVGPGLLSFVAEVGRQGVALPVFNASWETMGLDGTCELSMEYGEISREYIDHPQTTPTASDPQYRKTSVEFSWPEPQPSNTEGSARLTCRSADGTLSESLEVVLKVK